MIALENHLRTNISEVPFREINIYVAQAAGLRSSRLTADYNRILSFRLRRKLAACATSLLLRLTYCRFCAHSEPSFPGGHRYALVYCQSSLSPARQPDKWQAKKEVNCRSQ